MKRLLLVALLLVLLLPHVQALQMLSGDHISVDSPIDDDIFAAGDTITINAPVAGLVIAGGVININAPVNGDVFVAGGQIAVNSDVSGKIVVAGGEVNLHPTAVISRDAAIAGGAVSNAGTIAGNLTVRAEKFQNTGSAGFIDFKREEGPQVFEPRLRQLTSIVHLLMAVGFIILGIILLKLFPVQFFRVEEEVRESPLRNTAVGFALILISVILIFLLAITIVGLPVAFIMGMLFIIALMLSYLFVSFAVGRKIVDVLKVKTNDILIFILGFVILSLLFQIPYAGGLISLVAVSLGFGALLYAVRNNWQSLTAGS